MCSFLSEQIVCNKRCLHLWLEVPCYCNVFFHSLFKLTHILYTSFLWHFPLLNMEDISNFVIMFLHYYKSTRWSRCTRFLSGYPITRLIGHYFEHYSCLLEAFFSTSVILIFVWLWIHINTFGSVAICLIWLFLFLSDINWYQWCELLNDLFFYFCIPACLALVKEINAFCYLKLDVLYS